MMRQRRVDRRGQAIVEYLLVAAAVILGLVAVAGVLKTSVGDIAGQSKTAIGNASDQLGGLTAIEDKDR